MYGEQESNWTQNLYVYRMLVIISVDIAYCWYCTFAIKYQINVKNQESKDPERLLGSNLETNCYKMYWAWDTDVAI